MIGCRCSTCQSDDPRDQRWRPSILIELAGGTSVLVDTSPDLRAQALKFGVTRVDAILFTHGHADHVLGLDEVRRFNVLQRGAISCFADVPTLKDLVRMFAYVFDTATAVGGGIPQLKTFAVLGAFCLGRATVVPIPVFHGERPILGYRVGAFAYLTDCSRVPDSSWPLLEGVEVLVVGALRDRLHPTHFTVSEAIEAAGRVGPRRTYFTHMCHDLPHADTCARLPDTIELAYDGLVVDTD